MSNEPLSEIRPPTPRDLGDLDWSEAIEPRLIRRTGVSSREQRAREIRLIRVGGQPKPSGKSIAER
jgi:hypothetical protein